MTEKSRPATLREETFDYVTDIGRLYIIITYKRQGKPFEVFINGHLDNCNRAWAESLGRTISAGLRNGVKGSVFVEQLQGIKCQPVGNGKGWTYSPADAVAKSLAEFIAQ